MRNWGTVVAPALDCKLTFLLRMLFSTYEGGALGVHTDWKAKSLWPLSHPWSLAQTMLNMHLQARDGLDWIWQNWNKWRLKVYKRGQGGEDPGQGSGESNSLHIWTVKVLQPHPWGLARAFLHLHFWQIVQGEKNECFLRSCCREELNFKAFLFI